MGIGGGDIKKGKRWAIYARDRFTCLYCGDDLAKILAENSFMTLEHIKLRSKGASNHPDNLITCCYHCNVDRGRGMLRAWWESQERTITYNSLCSRFYAARGRWDKDERTYRAIAHMLIGNGPIYGTELLRAERHPMVTQNDMRAKKQWESDPPAWLERMEDWEASQGEMVCQTCNRPREDR